MDFEAELRGAGKRLRELRGEPRYRRNGKTIRRYEGCEDPAALHAALGRYVAVWEAWRGEGGEGWFAQRPVIERELANEATKIAAVIRDRLRRVAPDSDIPTIRRLP